MKAKSEKSKSKQSKRTSISKSKLKSGMLKQKGDLELKKLRDRFFLPTHWSSALAALQGHKPSGISWEYVGNHDAKPISELLKGTEPIPQYVRDTLSRLLVPPKGYLGGKLKYIKPSNRAIQLRKRLQKEMKAYHFIRELTEKKTPKTKFDTAVEMAAEKYRMSRSWARNLNSLTKYQWLSLLQKSLDPGTLVP